MSLCRSFHLTFTRALLTVLLLGVSLSAPLGCAAPKQSEAGGADAAPSDTTTEIQFGADSGADGDSQTATDTGEIQTKDVSGGDPDTTNPDAGLTDADLTDADLTDADLTDADAVNPADTDAGPAEDTNTDGAGADASQPTTPPCGQATFAYKAAAGVKQVLVSGPFNAWASTPAKAGELLDDDGDGVWTLTLQLGPGAWQYKLIVDGKWITDPSNPDSIDDGFGGKNSLLTLEPCPKVLKLDSTNLGSDSLSAVFSVNQGPLDPKKVAISLDHQPISATTYTWKGGQLSIDVSGLSKGIHDLRVTVTTPKGPEVWLLKHYVGVSTDWRDATLYFVMTDRFVNGTTGNDKPMTGVDKRTNYQGGDFVGISAKLDSGYFSDLGVGALWLSWPTAQPEFAEPGTFPDGTGCGLSSKSVKQSPMKYTGYHGYWPVDPDKIEPRFGTLSELQTVVDKAHAKGIRILLDYTANHVHTASPWFKQHKGDGWFHTPAEVCADVGWDKKPIICWFTSYLADFNYSNPAAINASLDAAFRLAKSVGADGFRLDAVKHLEMDFIKALRARAKAEMELTGIDFYIVGETFTGDAKEIQSYIGATKIQAQFDFPANMQLLFGFAKASKGLDAMDATIRGIRSVYTDGGALMSTFIGNHDMARFISHASGGVSCGVWDIISNQAAGWKSPPKPPTGQTPYDRLKLAFTYLYTTPGIPLIYYGDEFGLPGAGDPDNRRMMRFGSALSAKELATLKFMQQLTKLRAAHPALRHGAWSKALWAEASFLSWARTATGDQVLVLLNRGSATKSGQLTVTPAGIADGTQFTEWFTGAKAKIAGGKLAFQVPGGGAQVWTTQ